MQEHIGKADIETLRAKIPDQLKGLFCEPPLLEGEDPKLYWGLLAAIVNEREPQSTTEWIAVHDLTTKLWEERSLRRASAALVRSGGLKAVEYFLSQIGTGEPFEEPDFLDEVRNRAAMRAREKLAQRARDYFGTERKERDLVRSHLGQYGITAAEIHAKATELNSEPLQMFEAMIARRERDRRKQRNEDERVRRRKDKQRSGQD